MAKDQAILKFPDSQKMMIAHVKTLRGFYWFECRRCRDQRTLSQNAYYWGVVLIHAARGMTEAWGEATDNEETHEFFKDRFLSRDKVDHNTGEIVGRVRGSTASLDTEEFAVYLDKIIKFCAEYLNTEIPDAEKYRIEEEIPL